jgi:hypothetical protein
MNTATAIIRLPCGRVTIHERLKARPECPALFFIGTSTVGGSTNIGIVI